MSAEFRPLSGDDATAFSALRRLVVTASPLGMGITLKEELQRPLEEFRQQLDAAAPSTVFGAFVDGALVATAGISWPTTRPSGAHKSVLWGVFTAPPFRGRSLARSLSKMAIEHAFAHGARRIYLYVFVPNPAAVHLYESLGFEHTGSEPEVLQLDGKFFDIRQMSLRNGPLGDPRPVRVGLQMNAAFSLTDTIELAEVVDVYAANGWSSAQKPQQLIAALRNSHSLVTARVDARLVGIGNAISDGHLVVYFPHLLVHPAFQRLGIGREMMQLLLARYRDFHQLMLTADGDAKEFYQAMGFQRAGQTVPMWIYAGREH